MTQRRLVSTASEGLRPLGPPELRSYELITELVSDELSPEHASLFAEPIRSQFGDSTEWYTSLQGPATRLVDLPEEAQEEAKARVATLSADIRAYAETLQGSSNDNDARVAEALLNALQVPSEESILVVENQETPGQFQPVLIDWASVPDKQVSVPNVLTSFVTPQARPVPPPSQAPQTEVGNAAPVAAAASAIDHYRWLMPSLLALVALLMALILYLLFVSCGLRHVSFLNFCPVASEIDDPRRDTAILQNRVLLLERELAAAERSCQPAATERQIGLTWAGRADLDLSLICPDGSRAWFRDKVQASCGATLEWDENQSSRETSPQTTERVLLEDPPEGTYTIRVELYEGWTEPGENPFDLNINFDGRPESFSGSVSPESRVWEREYEFTR